MNTFRSPLEKKLLSGLPSRAFADRLRSRIEMRGDDECWPFIAGTAVERNTYGQINLGAAYGGKRVTAPHAMLMLMLDQPLREGLYVCHTCHWKPCCNPQHLMEGTAKQNVAMNPINYAVLGGRACAGVKKRATHGEKQRVAQHTSRMRHCVCGYSVNAGTMAHHIKKAGHRLVST